MAFLAPFKPPIGRLAFPGLFLEAPIEGLVQQRLFQFLQRGFLPFVLLQRVEVFEE
jgi:hypothetical protein